MQCKTCGSTNQKKFRAEMVIHSIGLKNIDNPGVWAFPELFVCSDCGTAEFVVPEAGLHLLAKGDDASVEMNPSPHKSVEAQPIYHVHDAPH